ncbi:hypothetical protein RJT34_14573 [Clitoria ternatea]|uniref:3'-5' exonuclease domain-containing protein n=1 Tax=Clitoria ternatea TaxID=43366 RepID=A0AAN9JTD2_CLITE
MATVVDRDFRDKHIVYTVDLDGIEISVTVTSSPGVVRRWLSSTLYFRRYYCHLHQLVVGLGVQWTPGRRCTAPDTLQLCVGRRCLIFQLRHADTVPKILRKVLNNRDHTFVGFWNHSDRIKLEGSKHELVMCRNPLDLRVYVETEDGEKLAGARVVEIVEKCLGFQVEQRKDIGMSVWEDEHLSEEQVLYATVDAYCAFLIGKNIEAWEINK